MLLLILGGLLLGLLLRFTVQWVASESLRHRRAVLSAMLDNPGMPSWQPVEGAPIPEHLLIDAERLAASLGVLTTKESLHG